MTSLPIRWIFACALFATLPASAGARLAARPSRRATPTPSPCTATPRCPPDFARLPYVDPDAPKGGRLQSRLSRRLRQPQPLQRQGAFDRPGAGRQRLPIADVPLGRRAVHALRPHRADDRDRRRARPRRLFASTRARIFPTARRSPPPTSSSPSSLLKEKGPPAAARGLCARSNRSKRRTPRPCASILPAPTTANCR